MRAHLLIFVVIPLLVANGSRVSADVYVSNLGNRFFPDSPGIIGDIHDLVPGGDPFVARFTTGAGSFTMNSVTLEFLSLPQGFVPQSWTNINIRLYEDVGNQSILLGDFGSPTVNLTPTQWPQLSTNTRIYTTYIDFHPSAQISLQSFSQYRVSASDPSSSSSAAGLLFTGSPHFITPTDWKMSSTLTTDPFAKGGFLKLAVDATVVPEPSCVSLALLGCAVLIMGTLHQRC